MTQVNVDFDKLRSIYSASHSAQVTMLSLSQRERLRHFSDISRLKTKLLREGEKIVDEDYKKFWEELQAAGVGSIIYGRKGKPDRWVWYYSLRSIAKVVIEGSNDQIEKIEVKKRPKAVVGKSPIRKPSKQAKPIKQEIRQESKVDDVKAVVKSEKVIFIPLRNDCDVSISLPANITKEELQRINSALLRMSS